ncbi:hypothetical protein [Maritimibacter alexandrii]|uniref:hypothetical protein n=1 Tax=Maritimibacter alexandrii TaxID=2570355 RepID=UPI001108D03E|nr:hypothetical protein [Maritimibacter alexandrii]
MTRRNRPGSIQSAISEAYRSVGGIEAAATDLGLSIATLSYATAQNEDRPGGLGVNHLDRLGRMEPAAAVPLAEHFARLAGGVFRPVDLGPPSETDIHEITREFSDVISTHAHVHSDRSEDPAGYTVDEALRQRRELGELVAAALRMDAALDAIIEAAR